jgi:hypothetical protein
MEFTLSEARGLVEMFGGDDTGTVTVTETQEGKIGHYTDYPEEGIVELDGFAELAASKQGRQ